MTLKRRLNDAVVEGQATTLKKVNLITSGASLLSGDVSDCQTPQDPSCVGGIAAVSAFSRFYSSSEDEILMIQRFDKASPFVNMHPLNWVVNRFVLSAIFHLPLFIEPPSLLNQNKVDNNVSQHDLSGLQCSNFPFLLSNVAIPPTNSWHSFVENVHFDESTGLATVTIIDDNVPYTVDQIDAAKSAMNLIETKNRRNGCFSKGEPSTPYQQYFTQATSSLPGFDGTDNEGNDDPDKICWIPIIIFSDTEDSYWPFLRALSSHTYPPNLLITIDTAYEPFPSPQLFEDTYVWVSSCGMNAISYCQHSIEITSDGNATTRREDVIRNITLIKDDIRNLNDTMKDGIWESHIQQLAVLANDARINDPMIGETGYIPVVREGTYRACKAGECPIGNLFTDALRWQAKSDIAFTSSGGYRGPGKFAGPTRFGDLYTALPFHNTICTGTMTGISLFKLLNYTTSVATFEGEDTNDGGRLLQVSGMKLTYNTEIEGSSRLISVEVWDREKELYEPIDRLRLYTFTTDSYVCGGYYPYPELTVANLTLPGEVPGRIDDTLHHNIVADYLSQLGESYNTSIQGRLCNDTSAIDFLDLIESEETCRGGSVWNPQLLSCLDCPTYENVLFSDARFHFEALHDDSNTTQAGRVLLLNREPFPVETRLSSLPKWVQLGPASINNGVDLLTPLSSDRKIKLGPGDSLVLAFDVLPSAVSMGTGLDRTALGSVTFAVDDGGSYPGCSRIHSPSFELTLSIAPPKDPNHLGNIRYVGISLSFVVCFVSLQCIAWVYRRRSSRIVQVLQPTFLYMVCFGVLVMSSSMIPMSLDDEIISTEGCGRACMSVPWLLSMGFTVAFAALYAKLLRINRIFNHGNFRRITITQKDAMTPFAILFSINFILLLVWTILDPMQWKRMPIEDQEWNTVGRCTGGTGSTVLGSLVTAVNFGTILLTCLEAFKARTISGEYSEAKYIGIAVYGWLQILVVALPAWFLIDTENRTATYFLQVIIIFVLSLSMLLLVTFPAYMNVIKQIGKSIRYNINITGLQKGKSIRCVNVPGLQTQTVALKASDRRSSSSRKGGSINGRRSTQTRHATPIDNIGKEYFAHNEVLNCPRQGTGITDSGLGLECPQLLKEKQLKEPLTTTTVTKRSRGQDDQPLSAPSNMNSQQRSSQVVAVEPATTADNNGMQQLLANIQQPPLQRIVNHGFSFPGLYALDGFTSHTSNEGGDDSLFGDEEAQSQTETIEVTAPAKVLS